MQEHQVKSVSLETRKRCWSVVWFPVAGSLGWKLNRKVEHTRHRIQPDKCILSKTWEVEKNNKNRVLVYITQVNDSFGAEEINKLPYTGEQIERKQIVASATYNSCYKLLLFRFLSSLWGLFIQLTTWALVKVHGRFLSSCFPIKKEIRCELSIVWNLVMWFWVIYMTLLLLVTHQSLRKFQTSIQLLFQHFFYWFWKYGATRTSKPFCNIEVNIVVVM